MVEVCHPFFEVVHAIPRNRTLEFSATFRLNRVGVLLSAIFCPDLISRTRIPEGDQIDRLETHIPQLLPSGKLLVP